MASRDSGKKTARIVSASALTVATAGAGVLGVDAYHNIINVEQASNKTPITSNDNTANTPDSSKAGGTSNNSAENPNTPQSPENYSDLGTTESDSTGNGSANSNQYGSSSGNSNTQQYSQQQQFSQQTMPGGTSHGRSSGS